ncbi:MAG: C39 family peptidase [Bacilli bacterium]|nr:C39 family peptidase [Bacilli bacterium]
MKKKKKIVVIIVCSITCALVLAFAIPFIILGFKTSSINKNWIYLKEDEHYNRKVEVSGINLVEQHISCGYATIEMLSEFYGKKVTEDDLNNKNNGGVSTSSTNGFLNEINECINDKSFVSETYLANDELLKHIHKSLESGNPVVLEWAAKFENEWTLHFSVVTSLDIYNDNIIIYNPYGFIENIGITEFLNRSSFEAFDSIPLFLNFGFVFGAFHKNAIFYSN